MQFMEHLAHKKNILVTQFMKHEVPNDCRIALAARKSAFARQILHKIVEPPRYSADYQSVQLDVSYTFMFFANIR